jgi:hypothetical protein
MGRCGGAVAGEPDGEPTGRLLAAITRRLAVTLEDEEEVVCRARFDSTKEWAIRDW